MNKITTATDEQWEEIEKLRDAEIASQTDPLDINEVRRTVGDMWEAMGEARPMVLLAPSMLAAHAWRAAMRLLSSDRLLGQLLGQLSDQLHGQLLGQLDDRLLDQLDDRLLGQLLGQLSGQLHGQLLGKLDDRLLDQLDDRLLGQLLGQLSGYGKKEGVGYYSIWWRSWAAWYRGAELLGVQFDAKKMGLFQAWCKNCPYVLPHKTLCIVADNPRTICWQDNRLHNDTGPAVEYADGYSLYSLNGVAVDEQIVMRPETQTIEQISEEQNEEVKRIRIERFGWQRWFRETDAEQIDHAWDMDGIAEYLVRGKDGITSLYCACTSTAKQFFIEVDPACSTVEQAKQYMQGGRKLNLIAQS